MHKAFIALDFETADQDRDSACSIGLVRVENNQIVQRFYALIRPPRKKFKFTYVHGIRWQDVAHELSFGELWPTLHPLLQDVDFIAAHNASFDKAVLYACCDTYKIARPLQSFACTVALARRTWRLYPTKLPDVCRHLGFELEHHHALSDAEACAQIVIAANRNIARFKQD